MRLGGGNQQQSWSGEAQWLLTHIEVQTWKEGDFPKRMYVYNYRLFDRYDREVISLAVLADDDPDWRPSQFGYGRWGFRTGTEFPVAKLLDFAPHWQALETNPNPFATVVLAHLKALETRRNPADRQAWKVRLVKGLYERGLRPVDVRQLFRFIDWIMELPPALEKLFAEEVEHYEEEKHMPYITPWERMIRQEALLEGIKSSLKIKFGAAGLRLLPEIEGLEAVDTLKAVLEAIATTNSPEELRTIWGSAELDQAVPEAKPTRRKGRKRPLGTIVAIGYYFFARIPGAET